MSEQLLRIGDANFVAVLTKSYSPNISVGIARSNGMNEVSDILFVELVRVRGWLDLTPNIIG